MSVPTRQNNPMARAGMAVITVREMAAADANAEWLGVPRIVLMENAGAAVARAVTRGFPQARRILVVAGTGNNGGDGLVAARHLCSMGLTVRTIVLGEVREEPAKTNLEALRRLRCPELATVRHGEEVLAFQEWFLWADLIVDAVLGTGVRGRIREPHATAIDLMNMSPAPKIAVDVPSGMDPDTGEVRDRAVRATVTVTFHRPKAGLVVPGTERYVGTLVVAPIGIPREAELYVGPGDFLFADFKRGPTSRKGDNGRILIVGGSRQYSGAPLLSALAALRVGVDLAIIASPYPASTAHKAYSPDVISVPLDGDVLERRHVEQVLRYAERSDVVVVGPGLGTEEETAAAVRELARRLGERRLVLDADALKALHGEVPKGSIVTPHAGEFELLFGVRPPSDLEERASLVRRVAEESGTTVLLKGHVDVVSDGTQVKLNVTGCPGMTVGGTGDLLTGIVAAMWTKTGSPLYAAALGAFVNGLAGEEACREHGYHFTASDLLPIIPKIIRRYAGH